MCGCSGRKCLISSNPNPDPNHSTSPVFPRNSSSSTQSSNLHHQQQHNQRRSNRADHWKPKSQRRGHGLADEGCQGCLRPVPVTQRLTTCIQPSNCIFLRNWTMSLVCHDQDELSPPRLVSARHAQLEIRQYSNRNRNTTLTGETVETTSDIGQAFISDTAKTDIGECTCYILCTHTASVGIKGYI